MKRTTCSDIRGTACRDATVCILIAVCGVAVSTTQADEPAAAAVPSKAVTSPSKAAATPSAATPALYKVTAGPYAVAPPADIELHDAKRDKDLLLRITLPTEGGPWPLIVFSHGAMGARENYQPLVRHWAGHGYVCIQPTHADSLSLLPKEKRRDVRTLLEHSRTFGKHWQGRTEDVGLILDALDKIEAEVEGLAGRIDRGTIGMGGHSFGAHTSQVLAGATLKPLLRRRPLTLADPRPRAFLLISPQGTGATLNRESWREMTRPALVITGSRDESQHSGKPHTWRLEPFRYSPPDDKYLLFIDGAYHGFGGITGARRFPGSGPDNRQHVDYVRSASTAFWDHYLKQLPEAKVFLTTDAMHRASDGAARLTTRAAYDRAKNGQDGASLPSAR